MKFCCVIIRLQDVSQLCCRFGSKTAVAEPNSLPANRNAFWRFFFARKTLNSLFFFSYCINLDFFFLFRLYAALSQGLQRSMSSLWFCFRHEKETKQPNEKRKLRGIEMEYTWSVDNNSEEEMWRMEIIERNNFLGLAVGMMNELIDGFAWIWVITDDRWVEVGTHIEPLNRPWRQNFVSELFIFKLKKFLELCRFWSLCFVSASIQFKD